MRRLAGLTVLLLSISLLSISIVAAPAKKKSTPTPAAPDVVPHSIALFLGSLTRDGARQVTFKATAVGTRFFFEEPAGVTVYRYDGGQYVKEEFVRGGKLAGVTKRYAKK